MMLDLVIELQRFKKRFNVSLRPEQTGGHHPAQRASLKHGCKETLGGGGWLPEGDQQT